MTKHLCVYVSMHACMYACMYIYIFNAVVIEIVLYFYMEGMVLHLGFNNKLFVQVCKELNILWKTIAKSIFTAVFYLRYQKVPIYNSRKSVIVGVHQFTIAEKSVIVCVQKFTIADNCHWMHTKICHCICT